MASASPRPPVRITKVANRYLVFDIDDVMFLRRHHNLCSVFVGTMPQAPQQSVFMGMPVELMAEEARVLVDKGAAHVVDDSLYYPARIATGNDPAYLEAVKAVGREAGQQAREQLEARKAQFAGKASSKKKEKARKGRDMAPPAASEEPADADTSLFADDAVAPNPSEESSSRKKPVAAEEWTSTLTASGALNEPLPAMNVTPAVVPAPRGYPLYAHLHHKGYYMMPGIRFGCDYNVYPGDPLKFHSHFQATGYGWDDEIDLLDIVTAGRLGTNVKKSFLIGAEVPPSERPAPAADADAGRPDVRAFSIEWAAM